MAVVDDIVKGLESFRSEAKEALESAPELIDTALDHSEDFHGLGKDLAISATEDMKSDAPKKGFFKRVGSAVGKGLGYVLSPAVADVFMLTAAGFAIFSNPVGLAFGAAAATVIVVKYGIDTTKAISEHIERVQNDITMSKLAVIEELEKQLAKEGKAKGFDVDKLKANGLVGKEESYTPEAPKKPGFFKRVFKVGKTSIEEGSTAAFGIAAAAVTLNPLALTSSIGGYVVGVVSSTRSDSKEDKTLSQLEEIRKQRMAKLGIKEGDNIDEILAKRVASVQTIASAKTVDELKLSTDLKKSEVAKELEETMPKAPTFMQATKEHFKAKLSVQATVAMKSLDKSKTDTVVMSGMKGMGVEISIDSYKSAGVVAAPAVTAPVVATPAPATPAPATPAPATPTPAAPAPAPASVAVTPAAPAPAPVAATPAASAPSESGDKSLSEELAKEVKNLANNIVLAVEPRSKESEIEVPEVNNPQSQNVKPDGHAAKILAERSSSARGIGVS